MISKKNKIQLFSFIAIAVVSYSCLVPEKSKTVNIDSSYSMNVPIIDNLLVKQLDADDYGMKTYVMAFLKKGRKRWMIDSLIANQQQKAHGENIERLVDEGKLVVVGSFEDNTDLRGIYIFDVRTVAEAQQLFNTDAAIQAESLTMELHPWYGSAALMKTPEIHKTIAKKSY
jgi:hypothetical protein